MSMTTRELFRRIMRFETPDRTPFWQVEEVTGQAERKWYHDGNTTIDRLAASTIGFDCGLQTTPISDQPPIPAFYPKTLEVGDNFVIHQDHFGFKVKSECGSVMSPVNYVYLDGPLSSIDSWHKMQTRFDPLDSRRLPVWWGEEAIREMNNSTNPVVIAMPWGPARGIKNCYMLGFDRFMEVIVDAPEILEEIFDYWADYLIRFFSQFIDTLTIDAFLFKEDGMGYKNSTLVSPQMFRRIYHPHMKRVVEYLRSHGVSVIGYYSSGNLIPLLGEFIDCGINLITPVECAAGMDAVDLRKEYGRDLLMIGNISRQAIMDGKEAIRDEVNRKIPFLMESGGYIPAFDDAVMPDMELENVRYCAELIKSYVPESGRIVI